MFGEDCGKAFALFNAIDAQIVKDVLDWENLDSIGLDNTNSNMGNKNSIKSRILEKNPECVIAGCNCHLSHLAACKGGTADYAESGFDCEDHQVDLYYFRGSLKRKGILTEFLEFVGEDYEAITRFVSTRWLSLKICCDKELEKIEALTSMFCRRGEKTWELLS